MSGATTHPHAAQPPHLDPETVDLADLSPDAVRAQLERVLASETFVRSKGLCRFLQFAVEQKLRNQSVRLKEHLIGVAVFDRGDAFNPGADPIVRVQARRLRCKLKAYYEREGSADPLQIDLPCGGYVPAFQARTPMPPASPSELHAKRLGARTAARQSVVVLPFVNIGPHESERFSDGLTDELIHALSQTAGLRVVARTSAF